MGAVTLAVAPTAGALAFRAMNTDWWIAAPKATPELLGDLEHLVHQAEARYSRFRGTSLVSRLNGERRVQDAGLAALVGRALEIGRVTGGAFDIRAGAAVIAGGYDRSFELLPPVVVDDQIAPPVGLLEVIVDGDLVALEGPGLIDLGGIAKGWTIDGIATALDEAGVADYLIDGGGDIRGRGRDSSGAPWAVGVGDGLAVRLTDAAVCTSSTRRRRWATRTGMAHHIVDPTRGLPTAEEITNVVVVAPDTTTADAFATAVVASVPALGAARTLGAEVLFERDGAWEMTPGLEGWLL